MKKYKSIISIVIAIVSVFTLSVLLYANNNTNGYNVETDSSNRHIILETVPACPDELLEALLNDKTRIIDGEDILVQRLTEASLNGEAVRVSTGNILEDVYIDLPDTSINIESTQACPAELLEQMLADDRARGNEIDEGREILIQRLTDAVALHEAVYKATFYFTSEGVMTSEEISSRDSFLFIQILATTFIFRDGVSWELLNFDQPRIPVLINTAMAELHNGVDMVIRSNVTVNAGQALHLHLFDRRDPALWQSSSLSLSESGVHFPRVSVNRW